MICTFHFNAFQVSLFVERIIGDWDKTPSALRKSLVYRDAVNLHQATAAFLHFLSVLQRGFPAKEFSEAEASLQQQFRQGFLDPDLLHAVNGQVPPGDVRSVGAFRPGNGAVLLFCTSQSWFCSQALHLQDGIHSSCREGGQGCPTCGKCSPG